MFREQAGDAAETIAEGNFVLVEGDLQGRAHTRRDEPSPQVLRAENILPLDRVVADMREVFDEHGEDIVRLGFDTLAERLDADTVFSPNDPEVKMALSQLNKKAVGIAETTQGRINRTVSSGVAENKGVGEIADDVEEVLESMSKAEKAAAPPGSVHGRARRIASTTTTTGFEQGQRASMASAGVHGRMWLTQRDKDVRVWHLQADGQAVRLNEMFTVGGEKLQFPGDPTGSASNVINCRCTALPIPDEETFKQMQNESPNLSTLPQLS